MMLKADTPFVLFDDARPAAASPARLYTAPIGELTAYNPDEIQPLIEALRKAGKNGKHVAGYFNYEAGFALEKGLKPRGDEDQGPLAWFGIFNEYQDVRADAIPSCLPPPAGAWLSPIKPELDQSAYARAFATVKNYILAGDIYQANLTFRAAAQYAGDPLALYAAIRANAAAGYGGIVWTGREWTLSFSPELFFALKNGRVTTKPMKGTARRLADSVADAAAAAELKADPKQRAENLMIVDLLRNDLSRVCEAGSVQAPDLFRIESYPTVHQMTSVVTADLSPGEDALSLMEAIFPCGSITGAPKIRAMEIIEELESSPRGVYCGSIGRIDADGEAAFNVAIRTFRLNEQTKQASLGLGSGVVADSQMGDEWSECLDKGEFARMSGYGFDLIETMRFEPATGILRLELHLERMKESARALGFEFDHHAARNQLHAVTFHLEKSSKIRLLQAIRGATSVEVRDAPEAVNELIKVALVPLPVSHSDFRLRHKISDRAFYDDARRAAVGCGEVVFIGADGYLTEGSIHSLFVEREGMLLTPPLSRGLLPSVLRRELIENGKAVESDLQRDDLTEGFFLGNSVRGLCAAKLVA